MYLGIRSAKQCARRIIHANFHQQGSGGLVDGFGGANQRSLETLSGEFREHQISSESGLGSLRVGLGHVDVDPQLVRLGNVKKLSPRSSTAARVNQGANISVSRGNDTVEGSVDLFEGL